MVERTGAALPAAALNDEWRRLCADADANVDAAAWGLRDGGRRMLGSLAEVLAATRDRAALDAADVVLLGLVQRARQGDRLAARVVLQRVLPPLLSQALKRTRLQPREADPLLAEYLGAAWWLICEYPVERRPRSVAANVVLDAIAAVSGYRASRAYRYEVAVVPETLRGSGAEGLTARADGRPSGYEPSAEVLAERVLESARRAGVSEQTLELLVELHVRGRPRWHVAREVGRSTRSIANWRLAAEREVRAAVDRDGLVDV